MQLGLAFDQCALAEAQKADGVALQKHLADLQQGQGDVQQGQQVIIDLLKKQQLDIGGGGSGAACNPREQWRLDPKADHKFDMVHDDDVPGWVRSEAIGSGSFGTVFRGKFLGREPVAIKAVKFKTDKEMAAFRTEVTLLFRLSHPNITNLCGASIKGKQGEMVLELFPGSLSNAIYDGGGQQLSLPQTEAIAIQMASAMACLHGASPKVTHRDLKPDNVMLTQKSKAKIIDFGLAATKNSSASSAAKVGAAGTLPHQPPEMFSGDFTGTHKVDNHACAITVNEMFAGTPPFEGMSGRPLERAIVKGSRPAVPASMPAQLKEVVVACMAGPSQRPEFQAIQFRLQHAGEIAAMERAAAAEQEAKRRQAAAARAPVESLPVGTVFRVDNCEDPEVNGRCRTKGTHDGKPKCGRVDDADVETWWQKKGLCRTHGWSAGHVELYVMWGGFSNQDTMSEPPPTSGWFKTKGSDRSPSAMRIVHVDIELPCSGHDWPRRTWTPDASNN